MSWSYALREGAQSLTQETSRTVNIVVGFSSNAIMQACKLMYSMGPFSVQYNCVCVHLKDLYLYTVTLFHNLVHSLKH